MIAEAAFTALGWSVAVGAWVFALAAYPVALLIVYSGRRAYWSFADSLEDLHDSWGARLQEAA